MWSPMLSPPPLPCGQPHTLSPGQQPAWLGSGSGGCRANGDISAMATFPSSSRPPLTSPSFSHDGWGVTWRGPAWARFSPQPASASICQHRPGLCKTWPWLRQSLASLVSVHSTTELHAIQTASVCYPGITNRTNIKLSRSLLFVSVLWF